MQATKFNLKKYLPKEMYIKWELVICNVHNAYAFIVRIKLSRNISRRLKVKNVRSRPTRWKFCRAVYSRLNYTLLRIVLFAWRHPRSRSNEQNGSRHAVYHASFSTEISACSRIPESSSVGSMRIPRVSRGEENREAVGRQA